MDDPSALPASRGSAPAGDGSARADAELPPESSRSTPDRYVEMNRRLTSLNGIGAGGITLLTMTAIWGEWRRLAVVGGIQLVVIAFNQWIDRAELARHGRSIELKRACVNIASALVVNHVAGWPVPVWLWPPFVALAFDHLDRKVALLMLGSLTVVQDIAGLIEGVPWMYPVMSSTFALFASELSRRRFAVVREMLLDSDQQHAAVARAHASLGDAHERVKLEALARQEAERELSRAHKLEAVGRLASGIAHEINSPVQFVGDSILFLRDATADLLAILEQNRVLRHAALASASLAEVSKFVAQADRAESEADLPYVVENVPKAFERALEGLERVTTIVRSMKAFAHPDCKEMTAADINHAVETTLTIARNEYRYVADIETRFGTLPPVRCHLGDVNQAILNIVVNAGHAIADVVQGTDRRGLISVRTGVEGEHVVIAIGDTGGGIPLAVRERIFDPFFTTKEVGKGTGQGLAIARSVIVNRHGGTLTFDTELGRGTTFYLRLPIAGHPRVEADAAA
jgi:signal transduction histidine kinase